MIYGDVTNNLAAALDDARHERAARRRTARSLDGGRLMTVRVLIGTRLVAAGELLLGPGDRPPSRARPSRV